MLHLLNRWSHVFNATNASLYKHLYSNAYFLSVNNEGFDLNLVFLSFHFVSLFSICVYFIRSFLLSGSGDSLSAVSCLWNGLTCSRSSLSHVPPTFFPFLVAASCCRVRLSLSPSLFPPQVASRFVFPTVTQESGFYWRFFYIYIKICNFCTESFLSFFNMIPPHMQFLLKQ